MKKNNKTVIVFLIVMFLLSFTNLLNIKIDGEVLKLSGISVIVGIIAFIIDYSILFFFVNYLRLSVLFSSSISSFILL